MTGSITREIQAAMPDILWAIQEVGQDVTIRRPGHADVVTRAVLYQLDDQDKIAQVDNPTFKVIAWQGIFKPDVPILELPFMVIDRNGQAFVPDGPVQNPVAQDVVLFAHLLPLVERTRTELLVFTAPGNGYTTDLRTGNPVPAQGTPLEVPVRLVATSDPRVREMVGADNASVVLIGRWGSLEVPSTRPKGVAWGSSSPLTLDGQRGTLTVSLAYPDPDMHQEVQFGQRFIATWRAT